MTVRCSELDSFVRAYEEYLSCESNDKHLCNGVSDLSGLSFDLPARKKRVKQDGHLLNCFGKNQHQYTDRLKHEDLEIDDIETIDSLIVRFHLVGDVHHRVTLAQDLAYAIKHYE